MAVITQINIDISGFDRYEYVVAKQGDDVSRYIQIRFLNNGKVYVLDNMMKARAIITKSDNKEVFKDCAISGNYVELELDKNILAAAGTAHVEFFLTNIATEDVLTSADLDLKVIASKDTSKIESSNDYSSLREALLKADNVADKLEVDVERKRIDEIEKNSATKDEVDVERSRINNLIGLSENDFWLYDAELADIRVGANGQTYECAGEAVREQINEVKELVEETKEDFIKRNYHNSIICTERSDSFGIIDSAELPLEILKVFGKSVQNGTPYPTNPIEINSIGDKGNIVLKLDGWHNPGAPYDKEITIPLSEPLMGINDIKDEIVIQDGKCKFIRRFIKITDFSAYSNRLAIGMHASGTKYCSFNIAGQLGVNFYTDNKGQKSAIANNYAWVGNGRNDGQIYVPSAGGFVINDNRFTDKESTLKIIKEEQLEVIIAIETPIEKEFSFERLYAYREFTTIHNDEKAEMEVTYIADVKRYIDVKLLSIKQAQANMISLAPNDIQAQMIENDINNLLKESEVI